MDNKPKVFAYRNPFERIWKVDIECDGPVEELIIMCNSRKYKLVLSDDESK